MQHGLPSDGTPLVPQAGDASASLHAGTLDNVNVSLGTPTPGSMVAEDVRYWALQQRIARGETSLVKVADENMPADFLTKWIDTAKLRRSVEYAINARAAVH